MSQNRGDFILKELEAITFRQLTPDELPQAYVIICQVTDWLLKKGIQQWRIPLPLEIYQKRHQQGQNYGLFINRELAAVTSLMQEWPVVWQEYQPHKHFIWLATLASAIKFKGKDLGNLTIQEVEIWAKDAGITHIYLDCYATTGFLPRYYEAAKFQSLTRKQIQYNSTVYDTLLMVKQL